MDADRWRRLERIFTDALELPVRERAPFLDRACGGDASIRRDVESLIARAQGDGESLQRVVMHAAKTADATEWVGCKVGPYEILEFVGAGGMGKVYRAIDTRLHRTVAIKILPRDKTVDVDRKRRFMQEARAASALNHPNIVTIHDIVSESDANYLVMEYVRGKSLGQLIPVKGLPLAEAIDYATQIAGALAAAHAVGIVHRDIKPANVIVTPDSQVKVLDFGLAKLVEPGAAEPGETITQESVLTEPGAVMGTVAYMSPEQASGRSLDHRTDIFSLGVVLYEMLAGRRPFRDKTQVETMNAIINDPAPPLANQPHQVNDVLDKALAKDPKDRYQHAGDLALDLRRFERRPVIAEQRRPSPRLWIIAAAALTLVAGAVGWLVHSGPPTIENPLANAKFTRLTDYPGSELDAAISPDGKFVAFLADRDGPFDLFMGQLGAGRFENRTQGKEGELLEPTRSIGFSGDGSEIWLRGRKTPTEPGSIRLMPLMGGSPRPFLEAGVMVAWSPDGNRIAYHQDKGDPIFVADRTGANSKQIFINSNRDWHSHYLVWSHDARWIYFVRGNPTTREMDIWRISPAGGEPEQITYQNSNVAYPAVLDPRTLLYLSPAEDGSGPWLWAVDVEKKISQRVSVGLEQYKSLSASADSHRIVATVFNPTASLWYVPILDGIAQEQDVQPYQVPTVRALSPRFGQTSLFYLSSLGAGDGLWRYRDGQVLEIWKGSEGALFEPAAVSADGSRIAFLRRGRGRIQINIMSAEGTGVTGLADGIDARNSVSWSPDGRWIVVGGNDPNGSGLFKIPLDGGPPTRLVDKAAFDPVWSPDASMIVYSGPVVGKSRTLYAVRPDGTPVDFPAIKVYMDTGQGYRFMPDGKGLVYTDGVLRRLDFWLYDLQSKKTRQLTRLNDSALIRSFDITPDGKRIVFDRLRENSDIVLIDLPEKSR